LINFLSITIQAPLLFHPIVLKPEDSERRAEPECNGIVENFARLRAFYDYIA
jgi:hypothetical protein